MEAEDSVVCVGVDSSIDGEEFLDEDESGRESRDELNEEDDEEEAE